MLLVWIPVSEARQPNIIFVLADDPGWVELGYGNTFNETPHLDRLAKEGMRFTMPMWRSVRPIARR